MTDDAQTGLVPPGDFVERVRQVGVEFEPGDVERLGRFLHLMLETNKVTNLTAITDPDQAWIKHILDALTLVGPLMSLATAEETIKARAEAAGPENPPTSILSVIDVGSGGGTPGIPLAVSLPDREVTLLESERRKTEFLERWTVELPNLRVVWGRAEEQPLETFGVAVAKALAQPATAAEWCLPLVREGGSVVLWVGPTADADATARAAERVSGLLTDSPPGFLVLRKTGPTPAGFPRRPGMARKRPLA